MQDIMGTDLTEGDGEGSAAGFTKASRTGTPFLQTNINTGYIKTSGKATYTARLRIVSHIGQQPAAISTGSSRNIKPL